MKYLQIILVLFLCINSLLFNTDLGINLSTESISSEIVNDTTDKGSAPESTDNEKQGEEDDNLTRPDKTLFQEPKPNDSNHSTPQHEVVSLSLDYPALVVLPQVKLNNIDRLPKIGETYKRRIYYSKHRFDIG